MTNQTEDSNKDLARTEFWQTQYRGTNDNEYEIYVSCVGEDEAKSYEEWLGA